MTYVLDSGGVSALARHRGRLATMRERGHWPPHVPCVVLTESLTGDPRRDYQTERLLQLCTVTDVTESLARAAGRLRTATGRAGSVSAVDALVAASAAELPDARVLTSDPADLLALTEHAKPAVVVVRV